ncbi:MAG TPA: acyl-CoA dehydrogenase family protein [Solirubrobacterales bacterium]|nr:acyl-CoA dehydrogenase family protein [Solirubrobacterales bacterium]
MDFSFSEDQRELRATIASFLERHAASPAVRGAALEGDGFAREPWARLVGEMELTGLAIELERGGSGASFVEVGIALEELGRTLLPVPYLGTVVAAGALSGGGDAGPAVDAEAAAPLLERIAGGAVAAVAVDPVNRGAVLNGDGASRLDGWVEHVVDAPHADFLVLRATAGGEPALVAVDLDAEGVAVEPLPTLDQTRRQATVRFAGAPAVCLGGGAAARARDLLGVALAVESVGAAARCLEATVEYLKERVQFGRPIGSFQALKHRCADLAAELEAARSTAYYAAWAVDGAPEELPALAPLARAVCGEALYRVAAESIQLHGGIGFTWEHDAHLYFKRAKANELLAGGFRAQRRLAAERAGILEPA